MRFLGDRREYCYPTWVFSLCWISHYSFWVNSEVVDHHFLIYPSFLPAYLYYGMLAIGTLARQLSTRSPPHASVLSPPTNFPSICCLNSLSPLLALLILPPQSARPSYKCPSLHLSRQLLYWGDSSPAPVALPSLPSFPLRGHSLASLGVLPFHNTGLYRMSPSLCWTLGSPGLGLCYTTVGTLTSIPTVMHSPFLCESTNWGFDQGWEPWLPVAGFHSFPKTSRIRGTPVCLSPLAESSH